VPNIPVVEADAIVPTLRSVSSHFRAFTVTKQPMAQEGIDLYKSLANEQLGVLIADSLRLPGRAVMDQILVSCPSTQVLLSPVWPFELVQKKQVLCTRQSFLKKTITKRNSLNVQNLLSPQKQ